MGAHGQGSADMARFELGESNYAVLGKGPVNASTLFDLGMMYSVGRSVPIDYVTAHKWFNLAAMQGNRDAARLRQEIAQQMSSQEIAAAQRAARAWLKAA
jgi:uncharacterized protein